MSWYGSNDNGGHNTYNKPKPGHLGHSDHVYRPVIQHPVIIDHIQPPVIIEHVQPVIIEHVHRPMIIDHERVKHPLVGYTESPNPEQHIVKREEVVTYRGFPGMEDQKYSPVRKELYGTGDWSGKDGKFSPKVHDEKVRGPIKDSPWNNNPPSKDHQPPTRGKKYGNFNSDSNYTDDDDDDNVRFKNTRATRPNNLKEQEYYNENENPRKNMYNPYISTHPEKEKANDYTTRARMSPFGTPPGNETNYGTSNFKPMENSPPQFNAQPRIEHGNYNQEIIDSSEARRRYGSEASPGAGAGFNAENKQSGGTIDSRTAAKIYHGVLLAD